VEAHGSLLKRTLVYFGDDLPCCFYDSLKDDFPVADCRQENGKKSARGVGSGSVGGKDSLSAGAGVGVGVGVGVGAGASMCTGADASLGARADGPADSAVDLILVLGSSLQVAPFCAVPNLVSKSCCRVLVTKNPLACFSNAWCAEPKRGQYESPHDHGVGEGCTGVAPMDSSTRLAGRLVSLRPQWAHRSEVGAEAKARVRGKSARYQDQYVFDMDCDEFACFLMQGLQCRRRHHL
jgi:hypothetical protein